MSLAQRFERRLEGLVGGAFARVFKGQVEPVEIGTALQREAADKRNVMGNGRCCRPNRYRVTLSPSDHERLVPWEVQLTNSLAELVQEYLDENRWDTIGDIEVYLARDDELHTGVFGVASRMESRRPAAPPPARLAVAADRAGGPRATTAAGAQQRRTGGPYAAPPSQPPYGAPAGAALRPAAVRPPHRRPGRSRAPAPARPPCVVDQTNRRFELRRGSNVIGRGTDADLQLLDQGDLAPARRRPVRRHVRHRLRPRVDQRHHRQRPRDRQPAAASRRRRPGRPHPHRLPPGPPA